MAQGKMILFFIDFIGIPFFGFSLIENFGEFKGLVLTLIAIVYGIARVWFYIDKQRDDSRARKLKNEELDFEVHEKIGDDNDDK